MRAVVPGGLQGVDDVIGSEVRIAAPTHENVDGDKPILGPRMDCDVRFSEQDNTRTPRHCARCRRFEIVEMHAQNLCPGSLRSGHEHSL